MLDSQRKNAYEDKFIFYLWKGGLVMSLPFFSGVNLYA